SRSFPCVFFGTVMVLRPPRTRTPFIVLVSISADTVGSKEMDGPENGAGSRPRCAIFFSCSSTYQNPDVGPAITAVGQSGVCALLTLPDRPRRVLPWESRQNLSRRTSWVT